MTTRLGGGEPQTTPVQVSRLTVANHDGVDEQRQQSGLVRGSVVLEQGRGVVVADGRVLGTLGVGDCAGGNSQDEFAEMHGEVKYNLMLRKGDYDTKLRKSRGYLVGRKR